jgi:hypothetical protein
MSNGTIPPQNLTPEERKRYERLQRTRRNFRGRVNLATMPDRLTRTSARRAGGGQQFHADV